MVEPSNFKDYNLNLLHSIMCSDTLSRLYYLNISNLLF